MTPQAPPETAALTAQITNCMIVDDDAGICKAISFSLRRMGVSTTEVATLAELEPALERSPPELLFLDLSLGQREGADALTILQRRKFPGFVQVMSGRSPQLLEEVVNTGRKHGLKMLPPAAKPFRMGLIKDLVAGLGTGAPAPAHA